MTRSMHDPEMIWRRRRLRELKAEGVPSIDAVRIVNAEQDRRALERLDHDDPSKKLAEYVSNL